MKAPDVCVRCGRSNQETKLAKCAICFKFYCRTCAVLRHGKNFCSNICADYFFFGDEEEND